MDTDIRTFLQEVAQRRWQEVDCDVGIGHDHQITSPVVTKRGSYVLAPELVLTPEGAWFGMVIAIDNGEISFVGSRTEFETNSPNVPIIELGDHAIIPGFIDAHTHLGQAFGKAITGGEPAQIWRRIWTPMESSYDPETVYVSAKWMFLGNSQAAP